MADIIEVGNRIELTKVVLDKTAKKINYISQVLDIADAHEMNIAMPIRGNRIIPLDIGDVYRMCFYTRKGMYQCKAEIINRYREGQLGILVIRLITDPVKLQRRQYFRLSCVMDIHIHLISEEEEETADQIREKNYNSVSELEAALTLHEALHEDGWSVVTLVDVSGGGARFFMEKQLDLQTLVCLRFPDVMTEEGYPLELDGRVIACQAVPDRKRYEHRVEFCQVDVKERETLVKFIFEEERKQRKKEKGLD